MTANTTLLDEVTAIMADVATDVSGVATAFGRRQIQQHKSPPVVGWWPTTEAPDAPKKSPFPSGRRSLWTSRLALTVRCWATSLDDAMALRESVIGAVHRRWHGVYQWRGATWVADASVTEFGEACDLSFVVDLAILDRAPPRAAVTTTSTVPA